MAHRNGDLLRAWHAHEDNDFSQGGAMRPLPPALVPVAILFVAACAFLVACGQQTAPIAPGTITPTPARYGRVAGNGVTGHRLHVLGESPTNSLTVTLTWTDPAVDLDLALVVGQSDTGIPPTYGRYVVAQANGKTGTTERLVYAPTDPRARVTAGIDMLIWITNASASPQDYTIEVDGVSASVAAAQPDVHTYCQATGNLCKAGTCKYLASSGFSGEVSFSCPDAPEGVACLFTEQTVMPSEREIGEIGLSIVVDPRLPATWPPRLLTIRATGGGLVRDWQVSLSYTPPGLTAPANDEMRITGCVLRENFDNVYTSLALDLSGQVLGADGSVRNCNPVRADYWGFFVFPFGASGCPATAGDRIRLALRGRPSGGDTPYAGGQWLNTVVR